MKLSFNNEIKLLEKQWFKSFEKKNLESQIIHKILDAQIIMA